MRGPTFSRVAFLAGGAASVVAGCGGGNGGAGAAPAGATAAALPTVTPPPAVGPTASASVTLSRATSGAVPPALAGLSYEKNKLNQSCFSAANTTLIGCFKRLGTSLLRVGGNSVDATVWTPNGAGATSGQIAPADVTALAAFLRSTGWQIVYGINLATNTPANAAAEAAFAAGAFGSSLYGFEIGNECDLYAHNGIRPSTYTLAQFEAEWSSYAAAIRQSVPNAPLTGPAAAGSVSSWTVPFAAAESAQIRLLTQHYYRANGQNANSTIALLLAGDPNLAPELQQLGQAAAGIANGYRLAEANSFYNGGAPNVSDAYGTALWAIEFLLLNAQNGSAGVNFHGGGDGPGYTPIADDETSVVEVRPEYYGMLFVTQIAPGPMLGATVSSALQFSAFAVAGGDGATYVALINSDPATTAVTAIALAAPASRALPLVLAGTGLNATAGTTLGGVAIGNDGTWTPPPAAPYAVSGSAIAVNVAPASALLLKIT